jgi:enoyl-CoA hydratase/carnithine racemase
MSDSVVLVEKTKGIGIVTLNRPERRNAINPDVTAGLRAAFAELQQDAGILSVIVTGAGDKAFCAGGDLKQRAEAAKSGVDTRPTLETLRDLDYTRAMRVDEFTKPLIAAVNGYAAGGGFGLALACDIRLSSENAQFGASEVRWSHMAGTIAHILPRAVPLGWAFWMCYTGQFIDAETAFRIGLTQGLYPADQLMDKAIELAETINANGAPVISGTREFIYRSLDVPLSMAKTLEYLYYEHVARSENYVEGTLAFAEKRRPSFSDGVS